MHVIDVSAVIIDLKRRRQLLDDAIAALTAYQDGGISPAAPLGDSIRNMRPPFEITSGQFAGDPTTLWQNPAPDAAAPACGSVHSVVTIKR